jgi:hypothetical protein
MSTDPASRAITSAFFEYDGFERDAGPLRQLPAQIEAYALGVAGGWVTEDRRRGARIESDAKLSLSARERPSRGRVARRMNARTGGQDGKRRDNDVQDGAAAHLHRTSVDHRRRSVRLNAGGSR